MQTKMKHNMKRNLMGLAVVGSMALVLWSFGTWQTKTQTAAPASAPVVDGLTAPTELPDHQPNKTTNNMKTVYDFTVLGKRGEEVSLSEYKGKVLLIVNTASRCGFTPQYEALEAMYDRLKERGLEILDFPCNQFGNQAPESDEELTQFCSLNYGTKFPLHVAEGAEGLRRL